MNKFKISSKTFILLSLIYLICVLSASSKVYFLEASYYKDNAKEKKLTLGKGELISSDKPIVKVALSDPTIIDIQVLNEKQLFVRAKKLGTTTFLAWENTKSVPTRFDISVHPNIEYLTKQLQELDKNIDVEYVPPSSTLSSDPSGDSDGGGDMGSTGSTGSSASSTTSGPATAGSQLTQGKIILKGAVANAEVIARALQLAGTYVGDQGIRIISQPGGQVVDGLAGSYNFHTNTAGAGGGGGGGAGGASATAFGARDPLTFTTNKYANLSRGVIVTTQNGLVISFLTVKDPPQISIAIKFYEISRTLSRSLGFNTIIGGNTLQGATSIGSSISAISGQIGTTTGAVSGGGAASGGSSAVSGGSGGSSNNSSLSQTFGSSITGAIFNPDNGIGVLIQALQDRGEVKTLAEPNLVIANGEPASFLAGGEVPIIRSVFTAGGASQDVTYEPFGIKFTILPVVTAENKIFLQLAPEIRDIDTELSTFVAPPGSSIKPPAFKTRRTQTQVELESGQALAISGLLREDNTRSLRKVPGIGDIPILGTLFRSKAFRKGESELLIVVSPQIVRPSSPDKIAKISKPDFPYHEFDQLAPTMLSPHIKLYEKDEKGPNLQGPIKPGGYLAPENNIEEKSKLENKPQIQTTNNLLNTKNTGLTLTTKDKNKNDVPQIKQKNETINQPEKKIKINFIETSSKDQISQKQTVTNKELQEKAVSQNINEIAKVQVNGQKLNYKYAEEIIKNSKLEKPAKLKKAEQLLKSPKRLRVLIVSKSSSVTQNKFD